jgi:hypothetical protein
MAEFSISQLSALTKKDRRTITARVAGIPHLAGRKGAHLYDSALALAAIYRTDADGKSLDDAKKEQALSAAELNRARKEDLDRRRIPIEIPIAATDQAMQAIAAILKAAKGQTLTPKKINELLSKLRAVPAQLKAAQW